MQSAKKSTNSSTVQLGLQAAFSASEMRTQRTRHFVPAYTGGPSQWAGVQRIFVQRLAFSCNVWHFRATFGIFVQWRLFRAKPSSRDRDFRPTRRRGFKKTTLNGLGLAVIFMSSRFVVSGRYLACHRDRAHFRADAKGGRLRKTISSPR
jgi:hypothetical protein